MPIAPIRPAATVVVARQVASARSFEVLLVRRNDKVAFMAGAYVFPGGRVDDSEVAVAAGDTMFALPRRANWRRKRTSA
jgi:8-oxo-dGTP pyrophosphatase MutT (NUDIX family)